VAPSHQHLGRAALGLAQQHDARRIDRTDERNGLARLGGECVAGPFFDRFAQGCWLEVTAAASAASAGEGDSPRPTARL
jgi:hypothetical protein